LQAAHHLLMAHGRGVQALRAGCDGDIQVSIAHTSRERIPATAAKKDIEAARRDYFGCTTENMWNLSWWADPVMFGAYPAEGLKNFKKSLPKIGANDMALIAQKVDFLAYNCYSGHQIRAGKNGAPEKDPSEWTVGNPRGTLPWLAVKGEAPYWGAKFQTERYKLPIVFTENGFCNTDFVHLDGRVHDPQRIDFLTRYLRGIKKAAAEGVPVAGYFYWSVMDNFEWCEGYKDRFGLVHVDYETQKRTPKDSWHWYKSVIRNNGRTV
jgi:beta-glucosidase